MHHYLRSIGFADVADAGDDERILTMLDKIEEESCDSERCAEALMTGRRIVYCVPVSENAGMVAGGTVFSDGSFRRLYHFPYLESDTISEKVDIEAFKSADGRYYYGTYDDQLLRQLIAFTVTNVQEVSDYFDNHSEDSKPATCRVKLSALATDAHIILPVKKDPEPEEEVATPQENIEEMLTAAQEGNPEAIETLAVRDMNQLAAIARRIQSEDLYSIVDGTFMPQGPEINEYYILGDIYDVTEEENVFTDEKFYNMGIAFRNMKLRVAVNMKDLHGEPEIGRRFKGFLWLHGRVVIE